mmetsp:Transcript_82/g.264  ORF Transcript_82/g.264 Transcript_82/m.264 type:complete len:220 (-) Transcript_82:729-1388(-)
MRQPSPRPRAPSTLATCSPSLLCTRTRMPAAWKQWLCAARCLRALRASLRVRRLCCATFRARTSARPASTGIGRRRRNSSWWRPATMRGGGSCAALRARRSAAVAPPPRGSSLSWVRTAVASWAAGPRASSRAHARTWQPSSSWCTRSRQICCTARARRTLQPRRLPQKLRLGGGQRSPLPRSPRRATTRKALRAATLDMACGRRCSHGRRLLPRASAG